MSKYQPNVSEKNLLRNFVKASNKDFNNLDSDERKSIRELTNRFMRILSGEFPKDVFSSSSGKAGNKAKIEIKLNQLFLAVSYEFIYENEFAKAQGMRDKAKKKVAELNNKSLSAVKTACRDHGHISKLIYSGINCEKDTLYEFVYGDQQVLKKWHSLLNDEKENLEDDEISIFDSFDYIVDDLSVLSYIRENNE